MARTTFYCFLGLTFLFWGKTQAQLSEYGIPYSFSGRLQPIASYITLPTFNTDSIQQVDRKLRGQGFKDNRFAKMIQMDISPENSGSWEKTDEGRVWRVGIRSINAYSLYCVFNKFKLIKGCTLYLYDPSCTELHGAFTQKNNNKANILAIAPIPGDSIVIELDIPNELGTYGDLKLSEVGHDYINAFGKHFPSMLKDNYSESCEVDINCPSGVNWQTEKKAVCKMIIGGRYCTGTLIASATYAKIPYLITAYHCVLNDSMAAASAVFFFNYERRTCGDTESVAAQTLSGSIQIASTDNQLDFALLKLNDFPPISFSPYFAGWDNRSTEPQNGVIIHQPNGAGKKISIDNLPLVTGDFGQNYDTNSHWKVPRWNVGATEGGSSGGPFFNTAHRLVGTLTGGEADCITPINDYFLKFCLAWNKYPETTKQVKNWLDPLNSGVSYIDGYDPYGFNISNCDTAWNMTTNEMAQLSTGKQGNEWIINTNPTTFSQFAEKFYNPGAIKLLGSFFNIAKAKAANALSAIELKVWKGDVLPEELVYSKIFIVKDLQADAVNFMGFDSLLTIDGNFFIGYSLSNLQGSDIFAVKETPDRGIQGPSTMYAWNGTWNNINSVTSPANYTSLAIGITECYGKITALKSSPAIIYPSPCSTYFKYDIPVGVTLDRLECYNTAGMAVPISYQQSTEGTMTVYCNLPSGIYILKVVTKTAPIIIKFFVIKN